ncbi:hypothetical protein H8S95_07350 [Pontibacter sp. KCTC 32443]|uniref:hypothetical protein n=1 Tax=Pontibacter TaxID=323449 RepID=UPI00164E7F99|nr:MULTISPECIES: hypothetical protein [Pontibacter]MBC5773874.1 hypothetical protein [Pontibacter sp. KCTC 32443]
MKLRNIAAVLLLSVPLLLTACDTGENRDMPPESTTGNTQETGVEGSGDLPGTAAEDTSEYVNEVIGDDNAASGDSIQ